MAQEEEWIFINLYECLFVVMFVLAMGLEIDKCLRDGVFELIKSVRENEQYEKEECRGVDE